MNPKTTWLLALIAAALFAFIFLFERHVQRDGNSRQVLPGFQPAAVTSIQVRPAGEMEIRADRTNGTWRLTAPLSYPAQPAAIENLLDALQRLTFAGCISEREFKNRSADADPFGVEEPEFSVIIQQARSRSQIHIGHRTAPGNQVYVQAVGVPDIYILDADVLKLFPRSANDWRNTQFADLSDLAFDRLLATNAGNVVELQLDSTNKTWRMIQPLKTRADSEKISDALRRLQRGEIRRFVSDDPQADLESFGLQPPALSVAFEQGTNLARQFDFGGTNSAGEVYARRHDRNSVVLVANELLDPWRASYEFFRDRHLVPATAAPEEVEIRGTDHFILQRQPTNGWRIASQNFPVDAAFAAEFISGLTNLQVSDFAKDSVTDPDLPTYGLAPPAREYLLISNGATNELDFGTNAAGKIFARHAGESFVYAIAPADFARLPDASRQFRERRVWKFSEGGVARIVLRQNGKTRELIRSGTNAWSLAPGSQGIINPFAVEETVHQLGDLSADAWVDRGEKPASLGFGAADLQVTAELKNGAQYTIEFGSNGQPGVLYAAVALDNETWILQCPSSLSQLVQLYLTVPAG